MAIKEVVAYPKPHRGLKSDLGGDGFPPTTVGFEESDTLLIYDDSTRKLDSVFEAQNLDGTLKWYKLK